MTALSAPTRPRPLALLACSLALLPGCSWVHQRQAVEASRPPRLVDRLRAPLKDSSDTPPRVLLRVAPIPSGVDEPAVPDAHTP